VDFPVTLASTLFNLAGESSTQRSAGAMPARGVPITTIGNRTNLLATQDRPNPTQNVEMTFPPRVCTALSAQSTVFYLFLLMKDWIK
jgi:hypothetical protein